MSTIKALTWAFEQDDVYPGAKLLLIAIAQGFGMQNPDTFKLSYLAKFCNMDERWVATNLADLQTSGHVDCFIADGVASILLPLALEPKATGATKPPSPAVRRELVIAFDRTCEYCKGVGDDENGPDGTTWHTEHIVPRIHGGTNDPSNLTLACRPCNTSKKHRKAPAGTRSLADMRRQS